VQGHLLDFDLSTLHPFSNTLHAIAIGYLVSGLLMLFVPVWAQVAVAILLMVLYWALLMFIPVPVEGQDAVRGLLQEHANFAYSVEQAVLGRFIDGTDPPYTWVLSGMTFTATTLLGVFAGYILGGRSAPMMKFLWLSLLGAACLGGGWAWAEYGNFPIIKHIWTSSMVLWAGGWSYLLLALFYLVFDVIGLRFLAFPFAVIGMNAITIYVAVHFIPFEKIASALVGGFGRLIGSKLEPVAPHLAQTTGPFVVASCAMLLVWLLLYHLYRHKIFLRI
jgi:predicted acyltransferase